MTAALFMVCKITHLFAIGNPVCGSAKPLYRTGKAWFGQRPKRNDLSSSLGDWNIAETNEIAVALFLAGVFWVGYHRPFPW
jgi:hypothetical protein